MANKNDLRFRRTEHLIREGFIECVLEKGFQKISIADICKKGMISRNAFYLHFQDKYDLLDKMFEYVERKFIERYDEKVYKDILKFDVSKNVIWYIDTVIKYRKEIQVLIMCSKERTTDMLYRITAENPLRSFVTDYDEKASDNLFKLRSHYTFGAQIALTEYWLENYDCFTREQIIEEHTNLCRVPSEIMIKRILALDK